MRKTAVNRVGFTAINPVWFMECAMALKLRLACRTGRFTLFAVLILCGCASVLAAEPAPERYRVFLLRHISARQGIQFLADVNVTTVSQLNDANTLLVTAQQEVLLRAANLLTLVDSREKYAVKVLMPASEANQMPASDAIAAEIGDISIGTFFNLPGGTGHRAIIDTHNGVLVAVAPVSVMEKIVAIATRVRTVSQPTAAENGVTDKEDILLRAAEPNREEAATAPPAVGSAEANLAASVLRADKVETAEDGKAEPNKLFNELIESLAEAEKPRLPTGSGLGGVTEQARELTQAESGRALQPRPIEVADSSVLRPSGAEDGNAARFVPTEVDANAQPPETKDEKRVTKDEKARRSYEPEPVADANETLELTLPEELKIIDLLDMVGKYLNLNYVFDRKGLETKVVNLKVQGPIKVRELYPLVESVLKFTGLAMTRKGNLVTIVPIEGVLDIDPALIGAEKGQIQAGDVVVTRIFQLSYIDTASARTLIDGMRVGAVTELPAAGTIIVTGYAYRMSRVEELLGIIDKPGRPKQFKFRQLKYTMAQTLAPKVKQLVEQMGDISIAIAKPQTPVQQPTRRPVSPRQPTQGQPQPVSTPESAKSSIYLDADERTNRILMIGHELELAVVDDLIDALDVEQQDLRSLRMYEIQHVDAKEVRGKLEELGVIGASRSTPGRITGARAAAAPGAPGGAPSPTPAAAPSAGGQAELPTEAMQVVVIESTNSLLVNASPEQHALIATIIAYVDSETLQQAIPYVVYPLENQKPTDIAEVLNKLIQETIRDDKGKIQQVIKRQEDDIVIVPDENTFSLIVFASKKNQEWISNLVKSLDKRRPQVLIDVTLVEVSKGDAFDYQLNLLSSIPDLTNTSGLTRSILRETDPNGTNKVGTLTSSGQRRFVDFQANSGSGVGFYGDKGINALLTAVQTKSYGRVMAKPKILVNDNETGKIVAKDTTYVVKTGQVQAIGTGGASNTLITSTDYTAYDAGVTLDIKPHISEGDLLRLEIALNRSDFTPTIGDKPPNTTSSDITTVVTVPDGSTIILGGLVKLNQGKAGTKVPLLGDLPLIGAAFRTVSDEDIQKKLYIFVRAEIIRPGSQAMAKGDMERISDRNRTAFEKDEREFQDYNDVPGTKPKPMSPLRVLDAE
jgi:type II secretory pathway component GspD/PulD (secretin)